MSSRLPSRSSSQALAPMAVSGFKFTTRIRVPSVRVEVITEGEEVWQRKSSAKLRKFLFSRRATLLEWPSYAKPRALGTFSEILPSLFVDRHVARHQPHEFSRTVPHPNGAENAGGVQSDERTGGGKHCQSG